MQARFYKTFKTILKSLLWATGSIGVLLVLISLSLQLPSVQKWVVGHAIEVLEDKLGTKVELEHIYVYIPLTLELEGLYIEDTAGDTLLQVSLLETKVDARSLLNNSIQIEHLWLYDATIKMNRNKVDSLFNFNFILDAFASGEAKPVETENSSPPEPWHLQASQISLKNIRYHYLDEVAAFETGIDVGQLDLSIPKFDFSPMYIKIDAFSLANTQGFFTLMPTDSLSAELAEIEADTSASTFELIVEAENLSMKDIAYKVHLKELALDVLSSVGEMEVDEGTFNMAKQQIELNEVNLTRTGSEVVFGKKATTQTSIATDLPNEKQEEPDTSAGWTVAINTTSTEDISFGMKDQNHPTLPSGFDLSHMSIREIALEAEDIYYSASNMYGKVLNLSGKEKSGLRLSTFKGDVQMVDTAIYINDFELITPNSKFGRQIQLSYPSLDEIASSPEKLHFLFDLDENYLGAKDISYFQHFLPKLPMELSDLGKISVDIKANGFLSGFTFDTLHISAFDSTLLSMKGSVKGLPTIEKTTFDIAIGGLKTTISDLLQVIPDSLLPEGQPIPNRFNLHGGFTGEINDFLTDFELISDVGLIKGNLRVFDSLNTGKRWHEGDFAIVDLDAGYLAQNEDLGLVSMKGSLDLWEDTLDVFNAYGDLLVQEATYKNYLYKDLKLEGSFEPYRFLGKIELHDPNLDFVFDGEVDRRDTLNGIYDFDFDLKYVDFLALKLFQSPLKFTGDFSADLQGSELYNIGGVFKAENLEFANRQHRYFIDSMVMYATQQIDTTDIQFYADFAHANLNGNINIGNIARSAINQLKYYFGDSTELDSTLQDTRFEYEFVLEDPTLLSNFFVSEIDEIEPSIFKGKFDNKKNKIEASLFIPKLVYSDISLDTISLDIVSDAKKLQFHTGLKRATSEVIELNNPAFFGVLANDSLFVNLTIDDQEEDPSFKLSGFVTTEPSNNLKFHLQEKEVVINGSTWRVAPDNYLLIADSIYYTHNFKIGNGISSFGLTDNDSLGKAGWLQAQLKELDLRDFSVLFEKDKPLFSGIVDASFELDEKAETQKIKLAINDLGFRGNEVANLIANAQVSTEKLELDAELFGHHQNDVSLKGSYLLEETDGETLNFTAKVNRLSLKTIEPFLLDRVTNMDGWVEGGLQLSGNAENPLFAGNINFKENKLTLERFNSSFQIPSSHIDFSNKKISFNNFTILDSNKEPLKLKGDLYVDNDGFYQTKLDIESSKFMVMNTNEETTQDNFHGKLFIGNKTLLRGPLHSLAVNTVLQLQKGTELYYTYQEDEESFAVNQEMIEFVDMSADSTARLIFTDSAKTDKVDFFGIDLTANISIDRNTFVSVIIDPIAGDHLDLKGGGELVYSLEPTGNSTLSGIYEIEEGQYSMTFYKLVNRDFVIEKGSKMSWSGDVLKAKADINAVYNTKAYPLGLVSSMMYISPEESKKYNRILPFKVYLRFNGELLDPELSFDIVLPSEYQEAMSGTVYSSLQNLRNDESALNKQVFALLIMNSFMSESPGANVGSEMVSVNAKNSVSRLLSSQLNQLSDKYIKGVNLNFEMQSYENSVGGKKETRTDLEMNLSKAFFNNRLEVEVGSNFVLEGTSNASTSGSANHFAGNIDMKYDLAEDGRYKLRAYKKNENEDIIEGEYVATGISFIFTKSFDFWKDIFKKEKKEKEPKTK
ncbi:translocation/assembly module TamB domain-containing protein [Flammeovirgaceae bacterium SG7u.111]|nr:translocation/assembly module TamB domain-containing protein [Flammeovirgaceae bacterium SG7u.132]WPO38145.1 translocation/assembly module TamB domain-containing protein [Flammeovirgaceae bacterium SG7u.111]